MPLLFYGWRISLRPLRTEVKQQLASGIDYQRKIYSQPRPYIAHIVTIDLTNPLVTPFVTPIISQSGEDRYSASATSNFVSQFDLKLAVNGSFFYPFIEDTPWSFYPHQGDRAIALGENIVQGKRSGKAEQQWNVICFLNNRAEISLTQKCSNSTINAVAGRELLVTDGKPVANQETKAYARTAVAVDQRGEKLWLIVVDGKQPFYSQGATLIELAELAIALGGDRALNLDGGGSSTLAVQQEGAVQVLNAPIHTKIPMRERPVANHLGFD
ncbi:MAG: phosphodiester glycosidase family protein [Cyanobacteria bacterium J06600_6]